MADWLPILLVLVFAWWPAPWLVAASIGLTAAHTVEEVAGPGGPLWSYLGHLAGVRVSERAGLTALLTLAGVTAACAALAYGTLSPWFLGLLAGLRLGDALFSHALPALVSRPNPGQWSALGYALEGALVLVCCRVDGYALALGVLPFVLVVPTLRWVYRRE